jgi:hypothetical protein
VTYFSDTFTGINLKKMSTTANIYFTEAIVFAGADI